MLTVGAAVTHANGSRVHIDVDSVVVRLALSYVSEEHGWGLCNEAGHDCGCIRIADRTRPPNALDVLVVRDTPSACQDALDAVLTGAARAVVLWDEPTSLAAAVDALYQKASVIPQRVIELAHTAPRLGDRQRQTLRLVAAGRSNREISTALHQSTSTTKRDIAELLTAFDAVNRAGLASAADRLGFIHA